ncbi:MAG: TonB-dependent receptor [Chitinophagaceae bacterium]|nr:TonB-dependent receptor [Chitinophagaceae bacterium]MDP3666715.1 TonB-dependent receptor [Sediminibacterium sp.]
MRILKRFCLILPALLIAVTSMAQVTTGTITGTVKDAKNVPLAGASIEVIHEPSGSRYKSVSTTTGKYTVPGLRVGGPYKITITYVGLRTEVITDITVQLGEPSVVDLTLTDNSTQLQEVTVIGAANRKAALISKDRKGSSTNINSRLISSLPTISRNVTDLTRLVPQSNGTSFAGQDGRAINFTLDGSIFNNSFGLSSLNGGQTNSAPISLDALQEIQINVSPYNLRDAGFTGASINAVTKSGTNTIHGTGFYNQRNEGYLGKKAGIGGKQNVVTTAFDVKQYGASLGGAIIKNKLFYFVNFEAERRNDIGSTWVADASNGATPVSGNISRVKKSELEALSTFLQTKLNYNPGAYQGYPFVTKSDKAVVRFDWNINDKHKLSVRGNMLLSKRDVGASSSNSTNGSRGNSNVSMMFQNSAYEINNNIYGVIAQLNSRFSNKISNELTFGYTANRDFRGVKGGNFPMVDIQDGTSPLTDVPTAGNSSVPSAQSGQSRTYISFGNDPFTPNNLLNTDTWQFNDNLTAYLGKHTLTAGVSFESMTFTNGFTALINGIYTFNNLNDFYTAANAFVANPSQSFSPVFMRNYRASFSNLPGGVPWLVKTKARNIAAYIQDELNLEPNFNLTYGIRFEVPYFSGAGFTNTEVDGMSFIDNNGQSVKLSTSKLPDAKLMVSPRIGFNYDIKGDKTTQLRGGIGLFTGRPPFVFVSNQMGNNGVLSGFVSFNNTAAYPFTTKTPASYPSFAPNPGVPASSYNFATTEESFRFPKVLRSNLAVDQKVYQDIIFTGELIYTQSLNNINYYNANLRPSSKFFAGPDTRPRFDGVGLSGSAQANALRLNSKISDAIVMESAPLGGSIAATIKLEKPTKSKGLGWMAAYTFTRARDYMSAGSIAFSSWSAIRSVRGNNNADMAYSDNEIRNRVIGNVNYRLELGNSAALQFSLFGQSQNQGRYSYTYNGDMNGDGLSGNDLIYVPNNTSELLFLPITSGTTVLATAAQQATAFDAFINQDKYLSSRRGKVVERNGALLPYLVRFDFSTQLELIRNIGKNKHTIQLRADIFNVGNMINSASGVSNFVNTFNPLTAAGVNASGVPQYRMTIVNNGLNYTTYRKSTSIGDVWQAQFGIRYIF